MSQPAASALSAGRPRTVAGRLLPLALLLVVGTMLGVTAVNAKAAAIAGWHPLALLTWANLGAAVLQLAASALARRPLRTGPRFLRYYLISGLLLALPNALAFGAARHVGAGIVALCFAFPLIFTYGLALLAGLERLQLPRLTGVVLGLAGALVIALGQGGLGFSSSPWLLAAVSAPVVLAVGNLYRSLDWPLGAEALELSPGMLLVGGCVLLGGVVLAGVPLQPAGWTVATLAFLAGQTMIFALLYVLYFMLQKLAGPVYLSQIGSVGALVGIALATLVLQEPLTRSIVLAGSLVAGGILLVNRNVRKKS